MNSLIKLLKNGIIDQNPVFVQLLSLCPLLAVTTSAATAITMGISVTAVMIVACTVISIFRKLFVAEVRIASFVVIVAALVTILEFMLQVYAPPEINEALGIFIPLIVVNCVVFARIETFASKNRIVPTVFDATGMGIGLTLGLLVIGIIREFFGEGSVFGFEFIKDESMRAVVMIMAPGAFFTLGALIMIRNYMMQKKSGGGK
jgi:electron transport complex protein RnfE